MPYLRLIEEVRRTGRGADVENRLNRDMLLALNDWVAQEPAARSLAPDELSALSMSVFGGWLFYLTKLQQGVRLDEVDRDALLEFWASFWSRQLDEQKRQGE